MPLDTKLGDYWVPTSARAAAKGRTGWAGRHACAAHVASCTPSLAACLAVASRWLALPLSAPRVMAGLAVSAAWHYIADRRVPLRRLAEQMDREEFWHSGEGLCPHPGRT
jgi:hypothetical protein